MSNGIQPLAGVQGVAPTGSLPVRRSGEADTQADSAPAPAALRPNPAYRIDVALGLVVMEFQSRNGQPSTSIPTAQQLEAYRRSAGREADRAEPTAASQTPSATPTVGAPPTGGAAQAATARPEPSGPASTTPTPQA